MAIAAERRSELFIDGVLEPAAAQAASPTVNPATEEVLGTAADAGCRRHGAVRSTPPGAPSTDRLGRRTPTLRVRCIRQLREAMREHIEELREITIAEVGAPRMLTAGAQLEGPVEDLGFCRRYRRVLSTGAPISAWPRRWVSRPGAPSSARRSAWSVPITPWNFPHQINLAKIGPALAAGNTVVLKPAPDTPWCAAVLGELVAEHTDIPPGVLNIVTSSDHAVGAMLAEDPRVDMVSFTGSTATGRSGDGRRAPRPSRRSSWNWAASRRSSSSTTPTSPAACAMAGFTASMHAGQGCAITTRLVVPRARYDDAVAAAAATMSGITPGDPTKPGTICGPVISARQRDRVQSYLDLAIAEGGSFACGGGRPADRDRGFFIEPTVIAGLDNTARVAREEIFGPVLTVIAHDGDDDAVRIANDSPYGLSGDGVRRRSGPGPGGRRPVAGRHGQCQRRRVVLRRRAVRRVQAVRYRPGDGCGRFRGVSRNEGR